jgi:regulator of sirC expression with transglutaminase-like and TPR domain
VVNQRQVLARMLTNLKMIYLKQQELEKALGTVERILLMFPEQVLELRDRGLLYYQLGQFSQAANDLEIYLAQVPDAQDAIVIQRLLSTLRNMEKNKVQI